MSIPDRRPFAEQSLAKHRLWRESGPSRAPFFDIEIADERLQVSVQRGDGPVAVLDDAQAHRCCPGMNSAYVKTGHANGTPNSTASIIRIHPSDFYLQGR